MILLAVGFFSVILGVLTASYIVKYYAKSSQRILQETEGPVVFIAYLHLYWRVKSFFERI